MSNEPFPVDPVVVLLDGTEDTEPKEEEVIDEIAFRMAQIGDAIFISDDHPIPDDWHPLDGSTLLCEEWPEYVESQRLAGSSFTLPDASAPEGYRFVVKLGEKKVIVPPQIPAGFGIQTTLARIEPKEVE